MADNLLKAALKSRFFVLAHNLTKRKTENGERKTENSTTKQINKSTKYRRSKLCI